MNFKEEFKRDIFINFVQHKFLPDDFIKLDEDLEIDINFKFIEKVKLIGKSDFLDLKVFEILHNSENDPRVSLTDESSKIMNKYNTKKALAVFISNKSKNYRLSLITIQTGLEGSKVTRKLSNPKRYSYYLGPDAKVITPNQYLQTKGTVTSFEDLLSRFSVEVVTEKFFDEFRERFKNVKEHFEKSNEAVCLGLHDKYNAVEFDEILNKFCFTFLGRLIFIYFIQRKHWIENDGDFIRKYVNYKKNVNLYLDFFSPLFFEVFAKKQSDRLPEINNIFKDTPYLNGGLFEKSKIEEENPLIYFDDKFLRSLILDFFEIYNFTVDENTLYDQEVSIDPEMLGKVFENTLEENERGKKGTFYTPREIVNFMVRDALLQYLVNETKINYENLKTFIYAEDINSLTLNEIRIIDEKLEDIKVLDPAVGSGAFPVEMLNILVLLRKKLGVKVGTNINEIELKKRFIRKNLYGVDIDSGAIEIAKLRLWLSLIVEYDKSDIEPLPNLDFQFRLGNSLQERVAGFEIIPDKYLQKKSSLYSETEQLEMVAEKKEKYTALQLQIDSALKYVEEMERIIDKYFNEEDVEIKKKHKEKFDYLESKIFEARIADIKTEAKNILDRYMDENKKVKLFKQKMDEIDKLEKMSKEGIHKLFVPKLHFAEVYIEKGGFDVVIGNPPYGVRVEDDIKNSHELDSKDSYGVFISTSIRRFLKSKGILSFIVSDTWLTIKSHLKLRKQVLEKSLHKIIRLNQDCFDATVNACIILLTNKAYDENKIIAADLTNISTRKEVEELRDKLFNLGNYIGNSNEIFAVYSYPQNLISINSNNPIFVGSPKLFELMNDITCKFVEKEVGDIQDKKVKVRQIEFNSKTLEFVRLGDIAEVKVGLQTGDNHYYLYQNPNVSGTYKNIEEYKEYLLSAEDLKKIRNNENIRLKVIGRGIHKSTNEKNFDPDLWFDGKYIIPYDKGGESDTSSGWLPNYFVPTNYFIDWSTDAIKRMKTYKIADRIKDRKENKTITKSYEQTNAAVFRNIDCYFKNGITFSITGVYAPTFRINSIGVFDVKGSYINLPFNIYFSLGVLTSKLIKILSKVFIYNCVDMQVDAIKEIPFLTNSDSDIKELVEGVISKQRKNLRYKFSINEQKEIDKIIYETYGLNKDDIHEIEIWYKRRYPRLINSC